MFCWVLPTIGGFQQAIWATDLDQLWTLYRIQDQCTYTMKDNMCYMIIYCQGISPSMLNTRYTVCFPLFISRYPVMLKAVRGGGGKVINWSEICQSYLQKNILWLWGRFYDMLASYESELVYRRILVIVVNIALS